MTAGLLLLRLLDRLHRARLELRHGIVCSSGLRLHGAPLITVAKGSTIEIGSGVVLTSRCADTALGVTHPVVLRTLNAQAILRIGAGTGISGAAIVAAQEVVIGQDCLIGADSVICDTDFHPLAAKGRRNNRDPKRIAVAPVRIGDNVFIGTRAIILKGVCIGDHAVIGAGSVVTRDIPERTIAAGNPARVVRSIPRD